MADKVSKRYQDRLTRMKRNVEKARSYFQKNNDRFNMFRKFTFDSSLTDDDIMVLQEQKKPQLEFNVTEAYLSRLRGEYAKYEPSILVSAEEGSNVDPRTLDLIEGYIKNVLDDANNNGVEYNIYSDTLSGGFSGYKLTTEYQHPMSFQQVMKLSKVEDPTLVGYDPMATLPHKADGSFCFKIYPKTKDEFEDEYPHVDISNLNYSTSLDGYSWSYYAGKEKVILLCEYYEKKKQKIKIVELSNRKTMRKKEYESFLLEWENSGNLEVPPQIVQERETTIEIICRYIFTGNEVLEYKETDFAFFPLTFVDGNSALLRDTSGEVTQMTRPYAYHVRGAQRLKNYAGQCLANELENMVQHKFMIAKEAIPLGYEEAYENVQIPNVVVYNAFNNNDHNQPLPQPREIQRVPCPPEVINTFSMSDGLFQSILGSYDPQIGNLNETQLSGIAIIESASLGNAAAMPYIVGSLQGLNQVGQNIVALIPKIHTTPQTIPIIDKEGNRQFVKVNQEGGIDLNYDEGKISVKITAGVSFGIQKSRALQQIIAMMQASPMFQEFMNAEGMSILLDNIEIRGIDQLKKLAGEWMEKKKQQEALMMQQQQQQMQMAAQQPNQMMIEAELAKGQQEIERENIAALRERNEIAAHDLLLKNKKIDLEAASKAEQNTTDRMKVMAEIETASIKTGIQLKESESEEFHRGIEMALKTEKDIHEQAKDHAEMEHLIKQSEKMDERSKQEAKTQKKGRPSRGEIE